MRAHGFQREVPGRMLMVNPPSCCTNKLPNAPQESWLRTGGLPRPCCVSEGSSWPPPPRHLLTKPMLAANHKLQAALCELDILPVLVYGQQPCPFPRERAEDGAPLLEEKSKQRKNTQWKPTNPLEKERRSLGMTSGFVYMDFLL